MSADEFLKVQRDLEDANVQRRTHPKGWEPGIDTAKGTLTVQGSEQPPSEWADIIRELGLDPAVWTIAPQPFKDAHFAVMPEALVEPCVLAGSAPGDTVLDPFSGSGTVGVVALRHGRNYIGCELNPEYADLSRKRICDDQPLMNTVEVVA